MQANLQRQKADRGCGDKEGQKKEVTEEHEGKMGEDTLAILIMVMDSGM